MAISDTIFNLYQPSTMHIKFGSIGPEIEVERIKVHRQIGEQMHTYTDACITMSFAQLALTGRDENLQCTSRD